MIRLNNNISNMSKRVLTVGMSAAILTGALYDRHYMAEAQSHQASQLDADANTGDNGASTYDSELQQKLQEDQNTNDNDANAQDSELQQRLQEDQLVRWLEIAYNDAQNKGNDRRSDIIDYTSEEANINKEICNFIWAKEKTCDICNKITQISYDNNAELWSKFWDSIVYIQRYGIESLVPATSEFSQDVSNETYDSNQVYQADPNANDANTQYSEPQQTPENQPEVVMQAQEDQQFVKWIDSAYKDIEKGNDRCSDIIDYTSEETIINGKICNYIYNNQTHDLYRQIAQAYNDAELWNKFWASVVFFQRESNKSPVPATSEFSQDVSNETYDSNQVYQADPNANGANTQYLEPQQTPENQSEVVVQNQEDYQADPNANGANTQYSEPQRTPENQPEVAVQNQEDFKFANWINWAYNDVRNRGGDRRSEIVACTADENNANSKVYSFFYNNLAYGDFNQMALTFETDGELWDKFWASIAYIQRHPGVDSLVPATTEFSQDVSNETYDSNQVYQADPNANGANTQYLEPQQTPENQPEVAVQNQEDYQADPNANDANTQYLEPQQTQEKQPEVIMQTQKDQFINWISLAYDDILKGHDRRSEMVSYSSYEGNFNSKICAYIFNNQTCYPNIQIAQSYNNGEESWDKFWASIVYFQRLTESAVRERIDLYNLNLYKNCAPLVQIGAAHYLTFEDYTQGHLTRKMVLNWHCVNSKWLYSRVGGFFSTDISGKMQFSSEDCFINAIDKSDPEKAGQDVAYIASIISDKLLDGNRRDYLLKQLVGTVKKIKGEENKGVKKRVIEEIKNLIDKTTRFICGETNDKFFNVIFEGNMVFEASFDLFMESDCENEDEKRKLIDWLYKIADCADSDNSRAGSAYSDMLARCFSKISYVADHINSYDTKKKEAIIDLLSDLRLTKAVTATRHDKESTSATINAKGFGFRQEQNATTSIYDWAARTVTGVLIEATMRLLDSVSKDKVEEREQVAGKLKKALENFRPRILNEKEFAELQRFDREYKTTFAEDFLSEGNCLIRKSNYAW